MHYAIEKYKLSNPRWSKKEETIHSMCINHEKSSSLKPQQIQQYAEFIYDDKLLG